MTREKKETAPVATEEQTTSPAINFTTDIDIPLEVREEIAKKAEALKSQYKLRKVYVAVVEGDSDDEKPFYIAYFRRPNLMHFSQYMNFVQKDLVQANKMLAQNIFLAGDKEMVDDDELFLYGTMQQLNRVIDSRNSDLVKV